VQAILRTLRVPSFGRLALTYALNEMADWFASIALAVLVYDQTGDPLATTALFLGNRFLPAFVVPALAARLDSLPAARTLAGMYVVEAVALAVLALTSGAFWLPAVLALACFDGTVASTARALTRSATVALMEPKGLLRDGNAALNLSFSTMNAGAPVLAGVIVAFTSSGFVLALGAGLFLIQSVGIAGARDLPVGEPETAPWQERLTEALAYVRCHRFLSTLLASQALVIVLVMMIPPIEIVYAKESLDVGNAGFGVLVAAWGIGMVLGSVVFARERARSILWLIAIGTLGQGIGYIGMGLAPSLLLACVAASVGGMGNGVHWVAVVTAAQEATEERYQGRIAGLLEGLVTGAPGLGFILGGAVTAATDPRITLFIAGGGAVLVLLASLPLLPRPPRGGTAPAGLVEPAPEPA
jgi:MFS family permease